MSSLKERIELLENDLKAVPSRISVYHDLPFAILRYNPTDEWNLRREVKLHELVPWKEATKYWQELLEGKYDWSSIDKQLREKGLVKWRG